MSIIQIILVIVLVLLLDYVWITANTRMYRGMYSSIQKREMKINKVGAVLAYLFILITFIVFVIPAVEKTDKSLSACFLNGGLMGLCIYGIYNFTNMAVFYDYSLAVSIIDTLWGCVLFTVVSFIVVNLKYIFMYTQPNTLQSAIRRAPR